MKLTGLWAVIFLAFASFLAYGAESHMAEALKHAEAATKATDSGAIAEHADTAKNHAKVVNEHLGTGMTNLDEAIDHAKRGHVDLAKKAAGEAVKHLEAAQ